MSICAGQQKLPRHGLQSIGRDHLILCEGSHDRHFLDTLLQSRRIDSYEVYSNWNLAGKHGNTAFGESLDALTAVSKFDRLKTVVIISDCDTSRDFSFKNIQDQIRQTEVIKGPPERRYPVPKQVMDLEGGSPAIAVIMVPWTKTDGNLETVLLEAAYLTNTKVADFVSQFATCVGVDNWAPGPRAKMLLRAYVGASNPAEPEISFARLWDGRTSRGLIPIESQIFDGVAELLAAFAK